MDNTKNRTVFITGASGAMGKAFFKQVVELDFKFILLLFKDRESKKFAKKIDKKYLSKVEIIFGDIADYSDVKYCVDKADYIFNLAAVIPPKADHYPTNVYNANFLGLKNLVDIIKLSKREIKFIHISTVAIYGNRDYKHPWGRVGDPLLTSPYDYYSETKLKAERYLLDSDLQNWVVLRQSGMLHKKFFDNNINDGLVFHTCWNVPVEWSTDISSGLALVNLLKFDTDKTLDKNFWKKCYNIGGGSDCRETGYDAYKEGFALMGAEVEEFFKPNWNLIKGFHCLWFYDSDILNQYLKFRGDNCRLYWDRMRKDKFYYMFGKIFPKKLLSLLVLKRLFLNTNAPVYWIRNNKDGRIKAFFDSKKRYDELPKEWKDFKLLAKNQIDGVDYNKLKDKKNAKKYLLNHGYDETISDDNLTLSDIQKAAEFRGGQCLSKKIADGDMYQKLEWKCHNGHTFKSSIYTVLKAGHWCPICCQPKPWMWGKLSKYIPFFAQVWYDTNDPDDVSEFPFYDGEDNFLNREKN